MLDSPTVRVLVTGASGFVGGAVAAAAAGAGHEVTGWGFTREGRWPSVDVTDRAAVLASVRAARPRVVVHAAYAEHGPGLRPVTVDGTRHVAEACAAAGVRLVLVSTDVVFDGLLGRRYTERDPRSPVTAYGQAKADAEDAVVAEMGDHALVVRTSLVIGVDPPARHERSVLAVLGDPVSDFAFFTDEIRCPIAVADLARGLTELAVHPDAPVGVAHLAGPEAVSRAGLAELVARRHGFDPATLRTCRSVDEPTRRPLDVQLDSTRATGLLGWEARPIGAVLV